MLVLTASVTGFRGQDDAAPSASNDSIRIVFISPDPDSSLRAGEKVVFHVEVDYDLRSAGSATVTLVIQQGESGRPPVANSDTQVVLKGAGRLVLSREIEIPDTNSLFVYTPLAVQGATTTRTVDRRAFKVVKG